MGKAAAVFTEAHAAGQLMLSHARFRNLGCRAQFFSLKFMLQQKFCYDDIWCEIDLKTADVHFKNCDVYRKTIVHDDVELQWCHTHKTKYG